MELRRSLLRRRRDWKGIEDRSIGTLVGVGNHLMTSDLTCAEKEVVGEKEVDKDSEVLSVHLLGEGVRELAGRKQVVEAGREDSAEGVVVGNGDSDLDDVVEKVEGCVLEMKDSKLNEIEKSQILAQG